MSRSPGDGRARCAAVWLVLTAVPAGAQSVAEHAVVKAYAAHVHARYTACVELAGNLRTRIEQFLDAPDAERLDEARSAWLAAREVYGTTEVFRFYEGPIDNRRDGVETWLNAWPVDEAFIDRVEGAPARGIIQDTERFPNLSGALLTLANERGGEANICIGWHAIEFLLWGQDLFDDGPGRRPFTDYVMGEDVDAPRRRQMLDVTSALLLEHLRQLAAAWAPDADNYRRGFEQAAPRDSLQKILTGMVVLSGFEMAGERLAVAYETQGQEDEHSCFSDNTHRDFVANQRGVVAVWCGAGDRPGFRTFARGRAPEAAAEIDRLVAASLAAVEAIPAPFDQAVQGDDNAPGRQAILEAIEALEVQAEALAALGLELGYRIPLKPSGV